MLNFVAGTDLTIRVVFKVAGEQVVPDLASVFYTVRNNVGSVISGYNDVAVATTSDTTEIAVAVLAAANANALDFENRIVTVRFKVSGQSYFIDRAYRLIDRIPMTVDADSCRSLIGFAPNELPDEDLDLVMGYFLTAEVVGTAVLDAALIAGTTVTYAANRAIAVKTLLQIIPSLELRALMEEKSQTASASRFPKIDFARLSSWLNEIFTLSTLVIVGESTGQGTLSLLALVTPVDAITGE